MVLWCAINGYWTVFVVFKTYNHRAIFTISFVFGVLDSSSKVCVVEYQMVTFSLFPCGIYIFAASKDASPIASVECQ